MNLSKVPSPAPSRQPAGTTRSKPTLEQIYTAYGCSPWPTNITRHLVAAEADDRAGVTELHQKLDRRVA